MSLQEIIIFITVNLQKYAQIFGKIPKNLRIRPIFRDIFGLKYLFSAESACLAWCALIRQLQNRFQN